MKPTVLVIEDNEAMRFALRVGLGSRYTIMDVDSIAEAKKALASMTPDVAILDLNLRDTKGERTLSECEAMIGKVPIVMLTGVDGAAVFKGRVAAVIEKGAGLDRIADAIHSVLTPVLPTAQAFAPLEQAVSQVRDSVDAALAAIQNKDGSAMEESKKSE